MAKTHGYKATIRWTGNQGSGTARYDGYSRDHVIELDGKPPLAGSSDPSFLGDRGRTNPEEMLLASISDLPHAVVPAYRQHQGSGGREL